MTTWGPIGPLRKQRVLKPLSTLRLLNERLSEGSFYTRFPYPKGISIFGVWQEFIASTYHPDPLLGPSYIAVLQVYILLQQHDRRASKNNNASLLNTSCYKIRQTKFIQCRVQGSIVHRMVYHPMAIESWGLHIWYHYIPTDYFFLGGVRHFYFDG